MCLLIESIKLKDGKFYKLNLHQARVNKAFKDLFPTTKPFDLESTLKLEDIPQKGTFKCRIVFDEKIHSTEYIPYSMRTIKSLKLVNAAIESHYYKLENRTLINEAVSKKGECDDIIIVRDGKLSDSSYSNIALWDGHCWFTPEQPLIYGVQRTYLLQKKMIFEKEIKQIDLVNYHKIRLFNAMIEFGEIELDISALKIGYSIPN